MAYEDSIRPAEIPQNIILENRKKLSVTGVRDVESFDEDAVIIVTAGGTLAVRGAGLHIERLSLDSGEVAVEGRIDGLDYEEAEPERSGFLSRLFK